MPQPLTPLPDTLGSTFTLAEARAAGISWRRLQRPDVERVLHGVYRRADARPAPGSHRASRPGSGPAHPAEAWREHQLRRARSIAPLLHDDRFFSHRTAAVILGLPVPPARSDDVEVGSVLPIRPPSGAGIRGHRMLPEQVELGTCRGLPVPSPASVWAMLGRELPFEDLVALGDAVIRRPRIGGTNLLERAPYGTLEELEAAVGAARRHGITALRRALPLLTTQSASPPESHLRLLLDAWGLTGYLLDHDVFDANGRFIGTSELAFPAYKVALEYEGDHHRTETPQWDRDIDKHHDYEAAGWLPIRITARLQYRRPLALRARIEDALRRRGWSD